MTGLEHGCADNGAVAVSILDNHIAMNCCDSLLLLLLCDSPPEGERIAVTDRDAKTDSKCLQPPSGKMLHQHTREKRGTKRTRHNRVLKSSLLGNFFTKETLIHHTDDRGVPLDVF